MARVYLKHSTTGNEFDIVRAVVVDGVKQLVLKGPLGTEFNEENNPERLKALGYQIVREP